MADLESLSAHNRSIWQPVSYMNPIDTYVGNKGKLAALKATQEEFNKADTNLGITQSKLTSKALEVDNPYEKEILSSYENRLNEIASEKNPYKLNTNIKNLARQYDANLNDPNSKLGQINKRHIDASANKAELKNNIDKVLYEENLATTKDINQHYDSGTKSYASGEFKKVVPFDYKSPDEYRNKSIAGYNSDQSAWGSIFTSNLKGKNKKLQEDDGGAYLVDEHGKKEYIKKTEAKSFFEKNWNTDSELKEQYKRMATHDIIRELEQQTGTKGHTEKPEVQKVINDRYEKYKKEYIEGGVDKLAFDKVDYDVKGNGDPLYMENLKLRSAQEALNMSKVRQEGVGHDLKNVIQEEDNLEKQKSKLGTTILKDKNDQELSESYIKSLQKGVTSSGHPKFDDSFNMTPDEQYYTSLYLGIGVPRLADSKKQDYRANLQFNGSQVKAINSGLAKLDINQQKVTQEKLDEKIKANYDQYSRFVEDVPELRNLKDNAIKSSDFYKTKNYQDNASGWTSEQETQEELKYLADTKNKDFETFQNYRQKYIENTKRTTGKMLTFGTETEKEEIEPSELIRNNMTIIDKGDKEINVANDKEAYNDIIDGKHVKWIRTNSRPISGDKLGGRVYKMITSDDKEGVKNREEYIVHSNPDDDSQKIFKPLIDLERGVNMDNDVRNKYIVFRGTDAQISLNKPNEQNYAIVKTIPTKESTLDNPKYYKVLDIYKDGKLSERQSYDDFKQEYERDATDILNNKGVSFLPTEIIKKTMFE